MGRTVIVGDVHACADELDELFDRVALCRDDRLVQLGDLVNRGPDPRRTIDLVRAHGGRCVRGNHEHKLLGVRTSRGAGAPGGTGWTAAELRDEDWRWLESWPLWLELAEHDLVAVHAGLVTGVPLAQQRVEHLLTLRNLLDDGTPSAERDRGSPWGASWCGPPHVVFGHNAQSEPQIHPWATGLDTGCVYGGRLTALVLPEGARVPPVVERPSALVSVAARRAYAPMA